MLLEDTRRRSPSRITGSRRRPSSAGAGAASPRPMETAKIASSTTARRGEARSSHRAVSDARGMGRGVESSVELMTRLATHDDLRPVGLEKTA